MKKPFIPVIILALAAGGWFGWQHLNAKPVSADMKLYGSVDVRQISPAFERSGRILEVLPEEGDSVEQDQLLARMDSRALELQLSRAEAEIAALEQNLLKLRNGSRPEELARAKAVVNTAQVRLEQARRDERRMASLRKSNAVSPQDYENVQTALRIAQSQQEEAAQALALLEAGAREEDIAMAEAQLNGSRAALALLKHDIAQSELRAPTDAVISSRLLEPGDMASPASPVFQLSIVSPKWVRAYASEPQMGRLRPGMGVHIQTDSFPEPVPGRIGSLSAQAEFTPKNVQTEELRTALVYEVRIIAEDAQDRLRLGMPVTVIVPNANAAGAAHAE